jgi:hypothetical protein
MLVSYVKKSKQEGGKKKEEEEGLQQSIFAHFLSYVHSFFFLSIFLCRQRENSSSSYASLTVSPSPIHPPTPI